MKKVSMVGTSKPSGCTRERNIEDSMPASQPQEASLEHLAAEARRSLDLFAPSRSAELVLDNSQRLKVYKASLIAVERLARVSAANVDKIPELGREALQEPIVAARNLGAEEVKENQVQDIAAQEGESIGVDLGPATNGEADEAHLGTLKQTISRGASTNNTEGAFQQHLTIKGSFPTGGRPTKKARVKKRKEAEAQSKCGGVIDAQEGEAGNNEAVENTAVVRNRRSTGAGKACGNAEASAPSIEESQREERAALDIANAEGECSMAPATCKDGVDLCVHGALPLDH